MNWEYTFNCKLYLISNIFKEVILAGQEARGGGVISMKNYGSLVWAEHAQVKNRGNLSNKHFKIGFLSKMDQMI